MEISFQGKTGTVLRFRWMLPVRIPLISNANRSKSIPLLPPRVGVKKMGQVITVRSKTSVLGILAGSNREAGASHFCKFRRNLAEFHPVPHSFPTDSGAKYHE